MRDYFRKAVEELDSLDDFRGRFREFWPTSFGCTIVNRARDRGTAHLTVHMRAGDRYGLGDIYFAFEENADPNGAHGAFTIDSDEFELFLTANFGLTSGDKQRLTAPAAAETLWEQVLERAGITHA